MNSDCESRVWEVATKTKNWNDTRGWPDGDIKKTSMGPCEPWTQKQVYFCVICNGPGGTRHHLVPKSIERDHPKFKNRKDTIRLCSRCHREVHYYFSHWELAVKFNSAETVKSELHKRKTWISPCS